MVDSGKKVFFYPAGRVYSSQLDLINWPPSGYTFVTGATGLDRVVEGIVRQDEIYFRLASVLSRWVPLHLVKAYVESFIKRIPEDISLVYSYNHPVFQKAPWIVHVEWVTALAGFDIKFLRRYRKVIEALLGSTWCKKVLTWSEVSKASILHHLDCSSFMDKICLVNLAVQKRDFVKVHDNSRVRLLFVGSANPRANEYNYNFHIKGGKEVLEAFILLNRRYKNLELVMRTDVPPSVKGAIAGVPNVTIIDRRIEWSELEHEFRTADIFVFPSHQVTVWGVILEALSYELPVVTTNIYANSEVVTDGVTGFLIGGSRNVRYYADELIPFSVSDHRIETDRLIRTTTDPRMVAELVEKLSILIENPELCRGMGRAGRREVEVGRFSIDARNARLKRIFDDATNSR